MPQEDAILTYNVMLCYVMLVGKNPNPNLALGQETITSVFFYVFVRKLLQFLFTHDEHMSPAC
jgi:hypothetical protein